MAMPDESTEYQPSNSSTPTDDEGCLDLNYPPHPPGVPAARPITIPPQSLAQTIDDPLLLSSQTRDSMWVDVAAVIFMVVALDVLCSVLLQGTVIPADLPADVPDDALRRALFAPFLALRMMVVILSIATILLHRGQTLRSIGLTSSGWAMSLLIGLVATAVAYGLALVWQLVTWLAWPDLWRQMGDNAERIMDLIPRPDHPSGFVLSALAVGIYEELLFRGFLLPRLRRATGGWTLAVVISSAVFTSLHATDQVPAALVPVAILSVVFSLVTIWRRSLIPAIVGHFVFDLCSLVGLYYLAGDSWT